MEKGRGFKGGLAAAKDSNVTTRELRQVVMVRRVGDQAGGKLRQGAGDVRKMTDANSQHDVPGGQRVTTGQNKLKPATRSVELDHVDFLELRYPLLLEPRPVVGKHLEGDRRR